MIEIPPAVEMSNKHFRKHLEGRHIPAGDYADLKSFHKGNAFNGNRPTHETYHAHCHKKNPEKYDHVHTVA
jgi:hypothetical protein